jgi:lipocalin
MFASILPLLLHRCPILVAAAVCFSALLVSPSPTLAEFAQQGLKLVGNDSVGPPVYQGNSVALSADGNTAIVGGPGDNYSSGGGIGAAWVYTRSNGAWMQQGRKLIANDSVGVANQGYSVALSGDGSTAIVGGPNDNSNIGAAWVYTRSGGAWTQGSKLIGTGAVEHAFQGYSVALSGDSNTAIVGGPAGTGAGAWVYARSGGVWTQQGKLVGIGGGQAGQGRSVALSADGNTAIVGNPEDTCNNNGCVGAAWVFTRSNGAWTQQGKLVGISASENAQQGISVALSADGNTAIVGGPGDNSSAGAAWVFTRSNGA